VVEELDSWDINTYVDGQVNTGRWKKSILVQSVSLIAFVASIRQRTLQIDGADD